MTSQYACPMIATTLCPDGQAHTFVNGCQTGPCAPIGPYNPDPAVCQAIPQKQYTTAAINNSIQALIQNFDGNPGLPSCLNFLLHYETSDGGTPTLPTGYTLPDSHPITTGMIVVGLLVILLVMGMLK